ncbi:DNA mismatch repair endonuclease MutL [Aciduricibacillus chroicocephali]|uniref:DNA mismatch repair protein MutL n=1 Tax=Aciduricibacillus chroicocephali TaxID=3054939 RepID=A0ABY9KYM2_9BACI|nr:DNA mismatch repair endonuclease MutL [Bacillaceae bacterium 44XB]
MKIYQLSDQLANKIAAGEVVERPASVVKELVENSIDAGSRTIHIELDEAGLQRIFIRDDGIGMGAEDAERAFLRHATSKIKNEHDLFRVKTLGFRGEALASIASVSKLRIATSEGAEAGIELELEGGNLKSKKKTDARKGTEISVESLFFNTPARLKYMKTLHTELGHITDLLNRLAMSHPEVRFKAIHNGKMLFQTSGDGNLLHVTANIYGMSVARQMIEVKAESLDFKMHGFIAKPEVTRASKTYMSTIVNGRYIRSYALNQAILRAYHTLLPIGRSPIAILSIEMDPLLLDVNVHPTKLEVRFSKEKDLVELVEETIRGTFQKAVLIPEAAAPKPKSQVQQSQQEVLSFDTERERRIVAPSQIEKQIEQRASQFQMNTVQEPRPDPVIIPEQVEGQVQEESAVLRSENPISLERDEEREPRVPRMYPIGQLQGTYIMAQNENGLYMIDQHAAQERIKYEYFKRKLGLPKNELQELLLPLTFEFTGQEAIFIENGREELERVGLFFEPFGDKTFIVRSHPVWFPKGEEEDVIREIVDYIVKETSIDVEKIREAAATMMSCKGSIKANHYLTHEDMTTLLNDLRMSTDPFTCPHGRPIIVHFTTYELEKMFKRIM